MESRVGEGRAGLAPGVSTALAPTGDEDKVQEQLRAVRFADYFSMLALDADAPLPEGAVEASYQLLCRRFDPGRFAGRASSELESALAEIRAGLDDAHEVLSDRLLRERYRRGLRG